MSATNSKSVIVFERDPHSGWYLFAKSILKTLYMICSPFRELRDFQENRQAEALIKKHKKELAEAKARAEAKRNAPLPLLLPATYPGILRFLFNDLISPFLYVFWYHPIISVCCILFSGLILGGSYWTYDTAFKDLPSISQINQRKQILTTKIEDRNGKLLYSIYKDQNRTLIPLSKVPLSVRYATIAIEDKDFYTHHGFSVTGILRAITTNLKSERVEGGSTITQQLVKQTLLTPEKTLKRKIRELLLSFLMEKTYTKDEILEMYFNEIPYGGSTYGIEEAAQRYFGKPANKLDLAESALLAGLPQSPSAYSPYGPSPELGFSRQKEVLRRMVEDKYITSEQSARAQAEKLTFKQDTTNIQAPHFVMYVRSLLAAEYGEDGVDQGGLEVRTSLDLDTQNATQQIVTEEVAKLASLRISNGAALMTNPQTGEILAMVGSKNYFDIKNDGQVNVTLSERQPGSSIKPLTYSIALSQGMSPSSIISDEPITFSTPGSPPYSPKNYDGRFHGNVTLRTSLASSYNIPAVKTLAAVGIPAEVAKAKEYGITTWNDSSRFGLSLTLGAGEVLMTDMNQLYGTFATYGNTVKLNPILEIKNNKGEDIYRNTCALDHKDCPSNRTLDPKVAYQISDILSDNQARSPAFGLRSVLYIPNQQVAVKTGTTNNLRDNWTFGYTTDRVVGVWVGNNDNTPMSYVASGITGASPIWNKIMRTQLDDDHPFVFPVPDGLVKVQICGRTGTLACAACPDNREELFMPGTEPTTTCDNMPIPAATPSPVLPSPVPTPKPSPKPANKIPVRRKI